MAYIGYQPSQLATAPFAVNTFTGDGSTTTFTLSQAVPGANEAMVEVVVENVQQNPVDAYTIGGGTNTSLIFSEAPASGAAIYVIHKGEGTYNLQPSTGSVTSTSLDPVLRNFTINTFTGNGSATTYTLTDTPYSANSIIVTVDGILQTATTNYTVSGTTLSFGTDAPASGAAITVLHLGFSTGNKSVADGTITPTKISSGGPYWTSAGLVGIGTTTPAAELEVSTATGSNPPVPTEIRISTTTAASNWSTTLPWGRLSYYSADASTFGPKLIATIDVIATALSGGNANLTFNTADGAGDLLERMRISNTGSVGIGNIAPAYPLDILNVADAVTGINVRNTSAGTTARAAVLLSQDTNVAASAIWVNSSLNANFAGANSLNLYNGLSAPIGLFTGGTQRMTIDASGNVGIATTSPSTFGKFAVVGTGYISALLTLGNGQIKFPATQVASADANTLDDYEEGTWTPTISSATGTITTSSFSGAKYTKIGNVVEATINITITTVGTASGSCNFTLPFTGTNTVQIGGYGMETNTNGAMLKGLLPVSSATMQITQYNNASPFALGNGSVFVMTIVYQV